MNSLKTMFRPTKPISKNVSFKPDELISNSQKVSLSDLNYSLLSLTNIIYCAFQLMLELGIIRQSANGLYHLLPLAQRSLDKLICIINKNMMDIGAQKISMPVLIHSNLWKKTGLLYLLFYMDLDGNSYDYIIKLNNIELMKVIFLHLNVSTNFNKQTT